MSFISTLQFSHIHKASKWQNWGLNENLLYFQGVIFLPWSTGSLSRFAMLFKVLVTSFLEMKFFSPSIVPEMLCSYCPYLQGLRNHHQTSTHIWSYPEKKTYIVYYIYDHQEENFIWKEANIRGLYKNLPRMYIFCWWNVNGRHKILLTLIFAFKEPRW